MNFGQKTTNYQCSNHSLHSHLELFNTLHKMLGGQEDSKQKWWSNGNVIRCTPKTGF